MQHFVTDNTSIGTAMNCGCSQWKWMRIFTRAVEDKKLKTRNWRQFASDLLIEIVSVQKIALKKLPGGTETTTPQEWTFVWWLTASCQNVHQLSCQCVMQQCKMQHIVLASNLAFWSKWVRFFTFHFSFSTSILSWILCFWFFQLPFSFELSTSFFLAEFHSIQNSQLVLPTSPACCLSTCSNPSLAHVTLVFVIESKNPLASFLPETDFGLFFALLFKLKFGTFECSFQSQSMSFFTNHVQFPSSNCHSRQQCVWFDHGWTLWMHLMNLALTTSDHSIKFLLLQNQFPCVPIAQRSKRFLLVSTVLPPKWHPKQSPKPNWKSIEKEDPVLLVVRSSCFVCRLGFTAKDVKKHN